MHIVLKKKKHLVKSEVHCFSVLSIAFLIYIYYKLIVTKEQGGKATLFLIQGKKIRKSKKIL